MAGKRSSELFERAKRVIPGGVNSPVRAFKAVGGTPPFIERGEGCRVIDVDGKATWEGKAIGDEDAIPEL